jgi:mitochondrial chaperone BCS1
MTTNHLEKLDPALIRPGRVDLAMFVGDATPSQARRLFTQFYAETESPELLPELAQELEDLVVQGHQSTRPLSMAALQGIFIRNGAADAVQACREMVQRV